MITALLFTALLSGPTDRASDLVDTAAGAGGFQTLLVAAEKAGLVEALRTAEALTILAPTDEAFAQVPEDLLQALLLPENQESLATVLKYHVIPGAVRAADLLGRGEASTLEGSRVSFTLKDGRLRANEALLLNNDIEASNGLIHVIDQVLIPEGFALPRADLSAANLIELAIRRGVPLFNSGQEAACATIYEITARSLVLLGEEQIGEAAMNDLRKALDESETQHPTVQAWTLRAGLDSAWRSLQQDASNASVESTEDETIPVFEFDRDEVSNDARWFSVNDDVMGGVSQGGFEQVDDSVAAFTGALSLKNNGGFSTMRSPSGDLPLGGTEGLVLRVRGDGRTYNLSAMKSSRRMEVRTYRSAFTTQAGEWQEIRIPFSALELSVMGRRFPGSTIDPADIRSLGFSISDKNEAPFRLEIDWIRAY